MRGEGLVITDELGRVLCNECCSTGVIFLPEFDDCRRPLISCAVDGCSCEACCPACGGTGYAAPDCRQESSNQE